MTANSISRQALNITLLLAFCGGCGFEGATVYNNPSQSAGIAPGISPNESFFPHKVGWKDSSVHGKFVLENGSKPCTNACHGTDFKGGDQIGCKTCHPLYPHVSGWDSLTGHGRTVRQNGSDACATTCHGTDLAGGSDPLKKSCNKCHTSFPHKPTLTEWANGGHGTFVTENNAQTECTSMCHKADAPTDLKIKLCSECHDSYPNEHQKQGWAETEHGKFMSGHGGIESANCTMCHGDKLDGGSAKVSCLDCHHSGGAGNAEWSDGKEHGSVAYNKISTCIKCHGDKLKGNSIATGCDTCHHANWGDTHAKDWVDPSEHGTFGKEPATACKLCHGSALDGGLSGVVCKTCHNDIYPHVDGWENKDKHGLVAMADVSKCVLCHEDINDCKTCHHKNDANWKTLDHMVSAKTNLTGCKACHGKDLTGGLAKKACFDCHDNGNHYPHANDWGLQYKHGLAYLNNTNDCKTACHGKDLSGGISGIKCKKCHTTFPHSSTWSNSHGDAVLTSSDKFDLNAFQNAGASSCAKCHGPTYSHKSYEYPPESSFVVSLPDGKTIKRCYNCHFAYPHIEGKIKASDAFLPWRQSHFRVLASSTIWGEPKDLCAKGDGCHFSKRKSTNPVKRLDGTYITLTSKDCTNFCHK